MGNHRNRKLRDGIFNGVFIFYLAFLLENILFKYVQPWQLFQHGRYFSRSLNSPAGNLSDVLYEKKKSG